MLTSAPIVIPTSSSSSSADSSRMSLSPGRYVPVHRRTPSTTSTTSQVVTYSRDELLALAPSTSWSQPEALSSSPEQFHHLQHAQQPQQGWAQAHEAMRNYLRVVCPEIALNRKMRKSLQYHQHQQSRNSAAHHSPAKQQPRPLSPTSSEDQEQQQRRQERPRLQAAVPTEQQQPMSRPATPSAFKRVTPRRNRPAARTSTRTARLNGFTAFHKQLSGVAAAANEADWRRGQRAVPVVAAAH